MPGVELHHGYKDGEPVASAESAEAVLIEKRSEALSLVEAFEAAPNIESIAGSFALEVENCKTSPECSYEAVIDNGVLKISVLLRWLPFVSVIGDFHEGKICIPLIIDEPSESTIGRLHSRLEDHIDTTLRKLSIEEGAHLSQGASINKQVRRWSDSHDLSEQLRYLKDRSKLQIRKESEHLLRTIGMIA